MNISKKSVVQVETWAMQGKWFGYWGPERG